MYKVRDKFIIEISEAYAPTVELAEQVEENTRDMSDNLYRIKGFNSLVFDENGLDKLEKYKNREENDYQRGLEDAWKVAKRIVCEVERGGLKDDELQLIFNTRYTDSVLENYSPSVAIEKIKMYEEQKKDEVKVGNRVRTIKDIDKDGHSLFPVGTIGVISKIDDNGVYPYRIDAYDDFWWYSRDMFEVIKDDEINVGDEVYILDRNHPYIVTSVDSLGYISFFSQNGKWGGEHKSKLKKTGRHFPQIAEVLKQMQEADK